MNRWMNNPQYLAQVGHFFGAFSVVLICALFGGMHAVLISLPCVFVGALIKEYWYDMRYELPRQSFSDSSMDFVFFCAGAAAGLGLAWLKFHVLAAA